MQKILEDAIALREQSKYEEAQAILLELVKTSDCPEVFYQCAWVHDVMELEREAVEFYTKAIALGLAGEDLRGAYIGLGSTYRCIGEYDNARETLTEGLQRYPDDAVLLVFLAMTHYNLNNHKQAMELLLQVTLQSGSVDSYSKAIAFYKDKLDTIW